MTISSLLSKAFDLIGYFKGSPAERAMDFYEKGVKALGEGKTMDAVRHFTAAIDEAPNVSKLFHHRADAYAKSEQHSEAIIDYDTAVRMNPAYPDTYLDRGNSRYAIGDLEEAVKDFSEAIRLNDSWAEAYANRAVVYAEQGDAAQSDQDAEKARLLGVDQNRLNEMLNAVNSGTTAG